MGKSISYSAQGRPCGSRGGNDTIDPNTMHWEHSGRICLLIPLEKAKAQF